MHKFESSSMAIRGLTVCDWSHRYCMCRVARLACYSCASRLSMGSLLATANTSGSGGPNWCARYTRRKSSRHWTFAPNLRQVRNAPDNLRWRLRTNEKAHQHQRQHESAGRPECVLAGGAVRRVCARPLVWLLTCMRPSAAR